MAPILAARVGVRQNAVTAAFSPTSLTGLALWLDAGQITGATDGAAVATWQDRSGNARDATQVTASKQPIYHSTGALLTPSGKPAVQFDGVDDQMAGAINVTSRAVTVIVVGANFPHIYVRDASIPIPVQLENGHFYTRSADGSLTDITASSPAGFSIMSTVGAAVGSPVSLYTNGVSTNLPSAALGGTEPSSLKYGLNNDGVGGGANSTGRVAELVIYNRILTTTERQQVEAYLRSRHGTP